MTKQTINIGTPDKGDGDPLRTAFTKVNANFTELYTALGLTDNNLNLGSFEFTDNIITTTDSSNIIIDQAVTITSELTVQGDIIPNIANEHTLGTPAKPFKSLYVSTSTIYLGNTALSLDPNTNELKINNVPLSQTNNVPTDVSDLTDNQGLLNGGGGGVSDLTDLSDVFISLPTQGQILKYNGATWVNDTQDGLPTVTIPAAQGSTYKGLQVSYGMVHSNGNSNELNVNKIVIHKPAITTAEIDPTGNTDYFRVSGLGDSDVLAMFVLYGDVNGAKPLSDLQAFAQAAIDNVILDNAVEGQYQSVADMRAAFYDNYPSLALAANGLDLDFNFYNNSTPVNTGATTVREGSGAIFDIADAGDGTYNNAGVQNAGTNYRAGHKIKILGTALGGVTPDNDCIVTVVSTAGDGEIFQWSVSGTAAGTGYALYGAVTGTNIDVGSDFNVSQINFNNLNAFDFFSTNSQGVNYVVGDVLTLPGSSIVGGSSPVNDITITVTAVDGGGGITATTATGAFPRVWPENNISDGGNDQYDTANYINTENGSGLSYNQGNIVPDSTSAFGAGSSYTVVYDTGIFGLLVTGNSSTFIETSGGSGADGNSITEAGNIFGPDTAEQTFDNAVTHINVIGDPYAGPIVSFTKTDNGNEVDVLIPDSGVGALETLYLEQEQQWIDVRDQDAANIAPATRAWDGLPSYQAYDIIVATFPIEPAAPGNLVPVANNAKNAYLAWQEALADFGPARGVGITRDGNNGIYNPYREGQWDSDVSPGGIGWNIDGWNDLSDVTTREYVNLYAAFGFGGLGNKIVGTECVIYLPDNGKYYAVKFDSWTQGNQGGGFAYTRRELDLNNLQEGIRFPDGTRLKSAEGIGRVKLESPGARRIEEVYGYKTVALSQVVTTNLTAVASRSGSNTLDIWVDTTTTTIDDIIDSPQNYNNAFGFEFSVDNNIWYPYDNNYGSDGNERAYSVFPASVTYNQGDTIYFRYKTGGAPVVWWNAADLPSGSTNFRGAVIDYHAFTGESTIIGTIHIVDDDGEENITHTEVTSGSTDGENDDLWLVQNEGTISYRRIDGEGKTLKVQWSAKVFYGSEIWD